MVRNICLLGQAQLGDLAESQGIEGGQACVLLRQTYHLNCGSSKVAEAVASDQNQIGSGYQ
jgi:hypothetical protein